MWQPHPDRSVDVGSRADRRLVYSMSEHQGEIPCRQGAAATLAADGTLASWKPSTRRALDIRSHVSDSSPCCDSAQRAEQQQLRWMLQRLQHRDNPAAPLCCLGLITAPGMVPPLSPSRTTAQHENAHIFGRDHHAQLDLLRISNYNIVCWCLWGPAMHFLAARSCCSRQISCIDPGAGCQPQVGQRQMRLLRN